MPILDRFKNAWDAFKGRDPTFSYPSGIGIGSGHRPDRMRFTMRNERSIVMTVYNRLAVDAASMNIEHVKTDENGRFTEVIKSSLNTILTLDANLDQTGRALTQDVIMSMFDEGCVAVVPTVTSKRPDSNGSYKIYEMRVGQIREWFPKYVMVRLYNEKTGRKEDLLLPKSTVAIIENPFYAVMNEPNSTLRRLIRTINNLDSINDQNASGKLDLIIQFPYPFKSPDRKKLAKDRQNEIEKQLTGSKYGVAYLDATEKVVQLNRPIENTLWEQSQSLMQLLFNQLGLTQTIFDGTADEATMINYYNRTIGPVLQAIADEYSRKFLSPTARTQGQTIRFYRDPFKLVPVSQLADIVDKFTRNEIASPNEMRAEIGWRPSEDPRADELRNRNLNQDKASAESDGPSNPTVPIDEE